MTRTFSTQDNYFWYDGLQQVTAHQQGQLNGTYPNYTGIVGSPAQQEDFGYDATGNWASCDSLSPANSQTRAHSVANEITDITSGLGSITPTYSLVGNMTALPINPGRIIEFIDNPVPRPRSARQFISPEFLALKNRLEELIHPALVAEEEERLPVMKMTEAGDEVE